MILDDLRWSTHIFNIIKKANKRVFFIVQLKRAKIPTKEIVNFYCCCVLEYACEVFYFALQKYLSVTSNDSKIGITSIIFPGLPCSERLEKANLTLLSDRRRHACSIYPLHFRNSDFVFGFVLTQQTQQYDAILQHKLIEYS